MFCLWMGGRSPAMCQAKLAAEEEEEEVEVEEHMLYPYRPYGSFPK